MAPFKHKHAKGARVRFTRTPSGGWVSDTLIVTTDLPVLVTAPGFDGAAFDDLLTAVMFYCKAHNDPYRAIEFEEG